MHVKIVVCIVVQDFEPPKKESLVVFHSGRENLLNQSFVRIMGGRMIRPETNVSSQNHKV